jgi:hypothetical protein
MLPLRSRARHVGPGRLRAQNQGQVNLNTFLRLLQLHDSRYCKDTPNTPLMHLLGGPQAPYMIRSPHQFCALEGMQCCASYRPSGALWETLCNCAKQACRTAGRCARRCTRSSPGRPRSWPCTVGPLQASALCAPQAQISARLLLSGGPSSIGHAQLVSPRLLPTTARLSVATHASAVVRQIYIRSRLSSPQPSATKSRTQEESTDRCASTQRRPHAPAPCVQGPLPTRPLWLAQADGTVPGEPATRARLCSARPAPPCMPLRAQPARAWACTAKYGVTGGAASS